MHKPVLVGDCMVPAPVTIEPTRTLLDAKQLMATHRIRHLPVVESKEVLGLITERDLYLAELTYVRAKRRPEEVLAEELCLFEPYLVPHDTPVEEVLSRLIGEKFGSALIHNGDELVGVFTYVDAYRVLHTLITEQNKSSFWSMFFGK